MSINNKPDRPPALSEDEILDATLACVLAVGIRRTTLADVARRLRVSRPTIYRRWPDVGSLVAAVMTREWTRVPPAAELAAAADVGAFASTLVRLAAEMRGHPLLRKILDVDPEVLLPYVFDRRGASQDAMLAVFEEALANAQKTGLVRPGQPALLARAVLLTMQSFVFSGATMADTHTVDELDTELRGLLVRYLST